MKKVGIILIFVSITLLPFTFADTGIIQVNIMGSDSCVLDLKEGWNLFSFCRNLQDNDISIILSSISNDYRYIMKWDEVQQSFDIYSPRASQNPFTTFNDDISYFIYMYQDALLDVSGNEPLPEQRNLIEGWNTPAYQYTFSTNIVDMFQGISDFRYLMKWNPTNQEFDIYSKQSSNNPFTQLNPGEGRFIYMENPSTIDY